MDYLKSLGVKRAAEVKRDADVGVAKSTSESGIKVIFICPELEMPRNDSSRIMLFLSTKPKYKSAAFLIGGGGGG